MEKHRLRNISARPFTIDGSPVLVLEDPEHLSEYPLFVPDNDPMVFILNCLDGEHTVADIQAEFMRRFGSLLMSDQINDIIQKLNENYFLENEHFSEYKNNLIEIFLKSSVRKSFLSGKTYPEDEKDIAEELESMLTEGRNVSTDEVQESPARPRAIITPHIDFMRGEHVYGSIYNTLPHYSPPDVIVILGTLHNTASTLFLPTRKSFETPLGVAVTDLEILNDIEAIIPPEELYADEFVHRGEHSVEFQVLWLQYIYRLTGPITILPILCSSFGEYVERGVSPESDETFQRFVKALGITLQKSGRDILFVAGADLSHIGPSFGDPEYITNELQEETRRNDQTILDAICAGDAERLFETIASRNDRFRVCGLPPIYTMLKVLGPVTGKVVDYEQSLDRDATTSVSFAGVVFY
jgi:hypothetical protein